MSVRDRRYENTLQFIFGGIITLAVLFSLVQHIFPRHRLPRMTAYITSQHK